MALRPAAHPFLSPPSTSSFTRKPHRPRQGQRLGSLVSLVTDNTFFGQLCNAAAEHVVELLHTWRTLFTLRYSPIMLVQIIFAAGQVYLLSAIQATVGAYTTIPLSDSLSKLDLCVQYLSETSRTWRSADGINAILVKLVREQLKPRLVIRAAEPRGSGDVLPLPFGSGLSRTYDDTTIESSSSFVPPTSSSTSCHPTNTLSSYLERSGLQMFQQQEIVASHSVPITVVPEHSQSHLDCANDNANMMAEDFDFSDLRPWPHSLMPLADASITIDGVNMVQGYDFESLIYGGLTSAPFTSSE